MEVHSADAESGLIPLFVAAFARRRGALSGPGFLAKAATVDVVMSRSQLQILVLVLFMLVAAAGATWLGVNRQLISPKTADPPKSERVAEKIGAYLKINAATAESYGLESKPVQALEWHPKLVVEGRVIANPHATLEVRAPFAGVLLEDPGAAFPRLGARVEARKRLAKFESRVNPLEKLDLHTKLVDVEARCQQWLETKSIREKRVKFLSSLPPGGISQVNLDEAAIQLLEANTSLSIAQTQRDLLKQTLESAGKKSVIVPLQAPIDGEIAEVGALPGANVVEGQLLLRIVDFRRILVRLDFPPMHGGNTAPKTLELETPGTPLEAPARWRAQLRGAAANVEIGLQKPGFLYEIVPGAAAAPPWRPGLFVKARVDDPAKTVQPAMAIPAAALLVHQGRTLVYLQLDPTPGRYKKLLVTVLDREGDTLYVDAAGFNSDDLVVSRHAQALLSEEFRSDVDDD